VNKLKNYLLAASGLMIFVLTMTLIGSGSVGAFETNDVRVINTKSEPVPTEDISDARREPLQAARNVLMNAGSNVTPLLDIVTVPSGKRLVIEQVSMIGQVPPGKVVPTFCLITVASGGGFQHDFLVNVQPPAVNGDALFRASQQVRLYADPGTPVRTTFVRSSPSGKATFSVTLSGYLVDVP
jgi:hypothetical protein